MPKGEIVTFKFGSREFGIVSIYRADERLQSELPELALPPMNEAARAAFMAVLEYEKPPANGSLADFLALAEARGFSAHSADWVPDFKLPGQHLRLYQPWVDWLSEHGLASFHEANTLSEENWDRWKPNPRLKAFHNLIRDDQDAAFDLLRRVGPSQPASTRLALLSQINAGGSFNGNYPRQVPLLKYFLNDRSAKIRDAAREKLANMNGLETEAEHAAELAKHIKVAGGTVTYKIAPKLHTQPFWVNWCCTTFDALAEALGLRPQELARQSDLEGLGSLFMLLVTTTCDVELRSIVASRMLDTARPDELPIALFGEVERPLWERGLRALFKSNYWNSVQEFLGPERGTLNALQMRELACFDSLKASVKMELETGELPVNTSYDPLRAVALSVDKAAAQEALEEALSLGMKIDHPRLTMLKFNLAL